MRRTGGAYALALPLTAFRANSRLTANVRPFLSKKGLLDVVVTERWQEGWHAGSREVHFVLDPAGATDVLACRFDGAERSSGEYASSSTTITLRQTAANPLAFDVVRQTTARQVQPKPTSQTTRAVDHHALGTAGCASPP